MGLPWTEFKLQVQACQIREGHVKPLTPRRSVNIKSEEQLMRSEKKRSREKSHQANYVRHENKKPNRTKIQKHRWRSACLKRTTTTIVIKTYSAKKNEILFPW